MATPRSTLLAGRYELGEHLGDGGMAEVVAAIDTRLGRPVAVKLLRADVARRPEARRRFEAEARAAARLNHPNVVVVYDSGEDDGVPFLVMERLPGDTLAREIARGPMPVDRVRQVGAAVLSALADAHRSGIVHRDVKPGNVLLADDGTPKVSDFGIAKTAEDGSGTLNITGELLATPAYLAPERIRDAPATPASDVYSVGVLLYEALAGRRPFVGDSPAAVLDAVLRSDARRLVELRPDAPRDLVAVVEQAMAHDPSQRFVSSEEMLAALRGEPVEQATIPLTAPPQSNADRASAMGATRTIARERTRPMPARARPHARPTRRGRRVLAAAVALVVLVAVGVGLLLARDNGGAPTPTVGSQPAVTQTSPLPAPLDRAVDRLEQEVAR